MKRILPIALSALFSMSAFAQTVLISENFTTYDGTTGTVPTGWTFSYQGNYTSTQSSGPSGPNSYKFGVDSATIITPTFTNADTIKFWYKGNATDAISALEIFETDDLVNWYSIGMVNPILTTTGGFITSYPIGHNIQQIKFFYHKSVGNCAFDDFQVISNATPVKSISKSDKPFTISPNPSNGPMVLEFNDKLISDPKVTIYNMVGNMLKDVAIERQSNQRYIIRMNNRQPGFYFIRIQTDKYIYTQRITITAMTLPKQVVNTVA